MALKAVPKWKKLRYDFSLATYMLLYARITTKAISGKVSDVFFHKMFFQFLNLENPFNPSTNLLQNEYVS